MSEDCFPPVVPENEEEVGEYYFESDPLALKDNVDYQQLIKALVKLQAQRVKAVKDVERLQEAREEVLKDPVAFVTGLQNGDNLDLPDPQNIAQIPQIDWEKYNISYITQGLRPKTRKQILQEMSTCQQYNQESKESLSAEHKVMVRGRIYDESKPQTFNQTWSDEEQRKLEELLIKYPDEPIAWHRWVKISKEIGTRTPLQVQSRVQKYFIALKREGLPVPGRCPKERVLKKMSRRRGIPGVAYRRVPSSFMKAFNMYEDLNLKTTPSEGTQSSQADTYDVSDEEDVVDELRNSEEYCELLRMKHIKRLKEQEAETGIVHHYGYSCDGCGVEPIIGPRWHCMECPPSRSVDICGSCVKTNFSLEHHLPSHHLEPIKTFCVQDALSEIQ
ncbi:ZZ-type zinc finger-containing protein 3-like isoform X1 [Eriocheir sinensis]|uniref:ZZ-type zinc finger-containing protein 3-like isoform X1 n=1 Tax=Eriocheir sinensis TaxID=95602 RepID=UPI0021C7930E|nr:ZZ-type zinc finger-containing protein 3-like isoform X1 [Eriocheir sinensis]XP_050738988.1 ZZ-type zinc finger-containing protein 3-like isoform X1 [Eriocheir sinensis]